MSTRTRLLWPLLACLACEAGAAPPVAPPPIAARAPAPAPEVAAPASQPPPAADHGYHKAAGVEYLEILHVPPGTPKEKIPAADAELPLLVAIHGRGDTPEDFKGLVDALPVAVRLIVPRAFDALPDGGWSWFPIRARSADLEALARGIDAANDRLAAMIAELLKSRPTRGLAVVTGFSQGGMLSFSLATDHPELIAAAVPVGGWLPPPLWPKTLPEGHVPKIVALHGEDDQVVRHAPTRDAVDALKKQGWPVTLQSFPDVAHALPVPVRRALLDELRRALPAPPEAPETP
jgi:phospholipase/carboxylesterase